MELTPLLEFFKENGPTGFTRYFLNRLGNQFGIEGFLVLLVGQRIHYQNRHTSTAEEWEALDARRAQFKAQAAQGLDVKEALTFVKHPQWRWHIDNG